MKTGYVSARKAVENYKIYWNHSPSYQTSKNFLKKDHNKRIMNSIEIFSGYYSYAEEYIRIKGNKAYRLTYLIQFSTIQWLKKSALISNHLQLNHLSRNNR